MERDEAPKEANTADALQAMLQNAPAEGQTASELVEIYEQVERAYRAAVLAGQPVSGYSSRTDLTQVV